MKAPPIAHAGLLPRPRRARRWSRTATSPPQHGSSSVIIGPTGVGKSVFLKAIAGLLPTRTLPARRLPAGARHRRLRERPQDRALRTWSRIMTRGLVFVPAESAQAMNPALTLEQNLRLLAPESRADIERRLKTYFGLEFGAFARLYPDEVSGGELQRITLMILLSRHGDLVLLDEPTVNLDRNLRKRFIDFLNAGNPVRPGQDGADGQPRPRFHPGPEARPGLRPGERPPVAARGDTARGRLREASGRSGRAPPGSPSRGFPSASSSGASSGSVRSRPSRGYPSPSTAPRSTASPVPRAAASRA